MLGTHPDITFAVINPSQFSANPRKEHFEQAKYICCYLAGTQDYTMVFDGNTMKAWLCILIAIGPQTLIIATQSQGTFSS